MSVKIRLSRIGKKHEPFYRVVVMDSRKKRDGAYLQDLGTYDAIKGTIITFDAAGYDSWVLKGAQPSDSTQKIYRLFKKVGLGAKPSAPKTVSKKVVAKQVEVQEEQPAKEEVQ